MEKISSNLQNIQNTWNQLIPKWVSRRTRFWESDHILRHINKTICGAPVNGFSNGLIVKARQLPGTTWPLRRGIAVACGSAHKEIALLERGLIERFDVFEISDACIRMGKDLARKAGVVDRIDFVRCDAFSAVNAVETYDFVHWNNSLHHMTDTEAAVRWSAEVCKTGGVFFMDEFVGPTRFQWSPMMLAVAEQIRQALPKKYLYNPNNAGRLSLDQALASNDPAAFFGTAFTKPIIEDMMKTDPSEAADSANIIPSVKKYFPTAQITITGGVVYHLALNDILQNFDETADAQILDELLRVDDMCSALGETHYATALAIKQP
jgi:SAM-dependent methyltransferase